MNKKHLWLMLAGCLIPLAALAAIYWFRVPVNGVITTGLILLCPALHLLMMRGMLSEHAHEQPKGASPVQSAQPARHEPANLPAPADKTVTALSDRVPQ